MSTITTLRSVAHSFFAVLLTSLLVHLPTQAQAKNKYAAIVIDAATDEVLYARHADAPRYPASLTKMMTLYILFERLQSGKLSYATKFRVNSYAAARPPSKLGLKPGSTISVKNVIGALVTKSANDVASTVAVNISGSEARFGKLMTRKARKLGMRNTVFKNASGLPNSRQKTTARDMATLSLRLLRDFPGYAKAFKTKNFRYKRRNYRNHNGLLYSYQGTEGIKTGYTRASGFNLAASVKRHNKHLVAVVMGGRTSRSRNREMVRLLSKFFPRAMVMRGRDSQPKRYAKARQYVKTNGKPSYDGLSHDGGSFQPASFITAAFNKNYVVQVGSFEERQKAVRRINRTLSQMKKLTEYRPYIMRYEHNGKHYHRARFAGFASQASARTTCKNLEEKYKIDCLVTTK